MQVLKKGFTLILGLAMILSSTAFVFADEPAAADAGKVTLKVVVGEHGKVNDKTGEWTQELTKKTDTQSGQTFELHVVADEGYVLDKVEYFEADEQGNGEWKEEQTAENFIGKSDFRDTVPELTDDFTLRYTFKESGSSSTDPGTQPGTDPQQPGTDPGTQPSTDGPFTFTWTINDGSLGKISQGLNTSVEANATSGSATYNASDAEDLRTIQIMANDNAVIEKVVVNGEEHTSMAGKGADAYTLTTGNVNMEISFKKIEEGTTGETFKIDTKAGEHGSITDPIASYVGGTEQTIVWTADLGYVIDTVKIDGVDKTEADNVGIGTYQGSTTFTTGNHSVEVTFRVDSTVVQEDGDAGKIELIHNSTYKVGDDLEVTVVYTPASQEFDADYVFESSDWEIVSNDKGTKDGKKITGVVPKGTASETFKVVMKTTATKSRFTVTFTQNGKTSSAYAESVGYDAGDTTDLSDGILGLTVDGEFYAYTAPTGENDEYFQSMTMLTAKPDAVVKVAIQKDDQVYEASSMEVTGIDGAKEGFTAKELFDNGTEVTTEGLEAYHVFTFGAQFDSKYTVPADLAASGMQALISLEDEDIVDDGSDEDVDEDDGVVEEDNDKGVVKTGDDTNMPLYASAMFMSMLLLGTLLLRRRVMNN